MDGSAPRSSIKVAEALGHTLVFPEPAGAMTLAPPAVMAHRRQLVAARSASGVRWPTAESDPASVFQRCTTPDPVAPGWGRRVLRRRRGVSRRPARCRPGPDSVTPRWANSGRPCARATRSALRCGRRSCSPTPGNEGALGRTRNGDSGRGPADGRSPAPAVLGVDGELHHHVLALGPGLLQRGQGRIWLSSAC